MKRTLQTLIMIIMVAVSYEVTAQCIITPLIIPNGSTTFCVGDSVQLGADSSYVSYLWSTGETTATIYALDSGDYTVYVTDAYGCTGTSAATLVTVNQGTPAPPGLISGATTVCSGSVQTYTVAAVSGATSYFWSVPNGWSGTSTATFITVTVGSTGGNISAITVNGCGVSTTNSILAVIVDNVPAQPGVIYGNDTVCQGSSQTYTIAAVPGATSYSWTLPNGWVGSSVTTSITASIGATGGTITVDANNPCGSSLVSTLLITVINAPGQPNISGPVQVCIGSSNTYSVPNDINVTGYTWTMPAGWTGTSTSDSIITVTGASSGNITVTGSNVCGSSSASVLNVIVDVGVLPVPDSLTLGTVTTTTATVYWLPDTGAISYTLRISVDSLNNWTEYTISPSYTYTFTGLTTGNHYDVCVSANNSCGSSGWDCINFISQDFCSVQFNLFPDTTIQHHYFITDTMTGTPPFHYLWSWGDSTYDTIPYPSHTYADSGFYTICLAIMDSTGCISTYCDSNYHIMRTTNYMVYISVIPDIMTGVKPISNPDNSVSLFPNPTSGNFTLSYSLYENTNALFKIMDITGREVYNTNISGTGGTKSINVSYLNDGIYYWEMISDKGIEGKGKITVMR